METPASIIGVHWFAGMPILPGDVAVGDSWVGERPFPSPSPILEPSVAIEYRLRRVVDGVATIEFETAAVQRKRGNPAAVWHVEGQARVRVGDGAFLDSDAKAALGDEDGPLRLEWSIRSQCAAATR